MSHVIRWGVKRREPSLELRPPAAPFYFEPPRGPVLPIVVEFSSSREWRRAVMDFASRLEASLGGRLVRVVALPDPEAEVYQSNVLVVLREVRPGDFELVARLASEVGERINPLLASEGEEDVLELFILAGKAGSAWSGEDLKFASRLSEALGGRLVRVVALPDPEAEVYQSNVLVVLREVRPGDFELVARLASEVGERINPLLASEGEEDVLELFMAAGGRVLIGQGREG